MPVTITRPRAARIVSTAATNGAPNPSDIAPANAATPSASVSRVRSAEAICELAAGSGVFASDELIFARVLTLHSLPRNVAATVHRDANRTEVYFAQAANASAKARSPGGPFSMARMARPPLL